MPLKTHKLLTFGIISLVILLVVAFGVYIPYLKAYTLVHPERRALNRTPSDVGITHYEDVQFVTPDGLTLKGWYIPPQNGVLIIFVHGHADNRNEFLDETALVTDQGYGALLFDLRNHGVSDGNITTLGFSETTDVVSAVGFVRSRAADAKIALFGHSMGAGAALLAAAKIPEVAAVIVESPFTSLEDNISEGVRSLTGLPPFPFAPLIVFFCEQETKLDLHTVRPVDIIAQISPRPVLFIHGELDTTIPVRNSHELYTAAKEPKQLYILPNVGHGGFLQAEPKRFPETILTFLETYLKRK
jgi:dipeptidyl aminopeptidase/acylaminoacyl peptidase